MVLEMDGGVTVKRVESKFGVVELHWYEFQLNTQREALSEVFDIFFLLC